MLCELAHNFPIRIAELLERDRSLTRNFREETVTDLLMASLVGLEAFGVRVQFPDEPTTGGDMDWIYAAPLEINGGRYLRLILQAKRASEVKLKKSRYWFYQYLDHDNGQQAQTLSNYAATAPDGMATLPLYILYHPTSALAPAVRSQPAIEGVNIIFASKVAPIVNGGCGRAQKRISYWRSDFIPLSVLLCWPVIAEAPAPHPADATEFLIGPNVGFLRNVTGSFHPDLVARRLQERRARSQPRASPAVDTPTPPPIEPVDNIPDELRRAIDGKETAEDRRRLKRPRAILVSRLTRDSLDFQIAEARTRPPG